MSVSNSKGLVLIMVLSSLMLLMLIVQETIFYTQIDRRAAVTELHSLKAYYAAKAGMEVALLRVKIYRQMCKKYGNVIGQFQPYLDMIWRFPFGWPPVSVQAPSDQSDSGDPREEQQQWIKNSLMGRIGYITTITPTSALLDINDLASPVPSLREKTKEVFLNLLSRLREENKDLDKHFQDEGIDSQSLVLNIQDWIDPNVRRGSENSPVSENLIYKDHHVLPPNRSFVSLQELHQVEGMTDTLYRALSPFLTVYGNKGMDINLAPWELISSINPLFPVELAQSIAEKNKTLIPADRFHNGKGFKDFLEQEGLREFKLSLEEEERKNSKNQFLFFDAPYNFHIQSQGHSGQVLRTLQAVYVDRQALKQRVESWMQGVKPSRDSSKSIRAKNKTSSPSSAEESHTPPLNSLVIYWKEQVLSDSL